MPIIVHDVITAVRNSKFAAPSHSYRSDSEAKLSRFTVVAKPPPSANNSFVSLEGKLDAPRLRAQLECGYGVLHAESQHAPGTERSAAVCRNCLTPQDQSRCPSGDADRAAAATGGVEDV